MKKKSKHKRKTDREVLKELFPPEIVREVDSIIAEIDSPIPAKRNPAKKGARPVKPWSKTWTKSKH